MSLNCWEFKKCGKENVCPAANFQEADGFLDGKNAGKACVYVTGTFCNQAIQGTHKDKEKNCGQCDYYQYLKKLHRGELSVLKFSDYVRHHDSEKIKKYILLTN